MLLLGHPALVNEYVHSKGGGYVHPSLCVTFGYLSADGRLRGGIVAYNHSGPNVYFNIALEDGFLPANLLAAALAYGFQDLGCSRLTMTIAASNLKSIAFVEKLGAYREATLQDGCSDGDLYIYCLRPDRCKIWSKLNGKKFGLGPAST